MLLRKLRVQNLKRLADLELDFSHKDEPRMWTVLIGENGTAKTSILQAVALAAAGSRQVNTVVGSSVKHLRDRRSAKPLKIEAHFDFGESARLNRAKVHPLSPPGTGPLRLVSEVSLEEGSSSLAAAARYENGPGADPLDDARAKNTQLWFVAGYGISRLLPDATGTPELARPAIERLEPLFRQSALISTGFANAFLAKDRREGKKEGQTSKQFARMIGQAVKLGGEELLPEIERFELRGHGGAKSAQKLIESDRFQQRMGKSPVAIAGVALSHGYQSTFAWIADLIGHVLLESQTELDTTAMEGLVLIDEIDLYLHPTWQASFIPALRRVFPRMQFVATTHSPVVLATLAPHEILRLVVDPETGDIVQGGWSAKGFVPGIRDAEHQPDPRMMTGGELYRTWFGLEGLTPNPLGDDLRLYRVLSEHPSPSREQIKELNELRHRLMRRFQNQFGKETGSRALKEFFGESP